MKEGRALTTVERAQRLAEKREGSLRLRWGTRALGVLSVGAVVTLAGAEVVRIWRLGKLPQAHGGADGKAGPRPLHAVIVLRDGYRVSSTRENTIVNMLAAFAVTFGIARLITHTIRLRGSGGVVKDLTWRGRHIHHFIPGALVSLGAGGVAIATDSAAARRWLAIPYGVGAALVFDEAALLLELEDVYWSDEGKLSVQLAFSTMVLLAGVAHALQVRRRGGPGTEADWMRAAEAWKDLEAFGTIERGR